MNCVCNPAPRWRNCPKRQFDVGARCDWPERWGYCYYWICAACCSVIISILHSVFCILYSVSVQRRLIYHAHAHRLYYARVRSMIYLVYGGRTIAMLPWLGSRAIPRPSEIAGIGTFPNLGHYAAGTVTHVILIGIHPLE